LTSDAVQIRAGVVADAETLAAFAARVFIDAFAADNNPQDLQLFLTEAYGIEQQTRELRDPAMTTLLAFRHQTLVGFAQLRSGGSTPRCVVQAEAVELQRFYVDQVEHGRGVAQILMSATRVFASQRGAKHVWLGVWERNARGRAFYQKMGFTDVGSHYFIVGSDRQTDRVLVAALSNDSY
jgi:diamine N-acetyltransferase